jgi:hypothetical protein
LSDFLCISFEDVIQLIAVDDLHSADLIRRSLLE